MKELSIEEKAKAYDRALKVLHKYDGANIMFTQDLKEEMFPELREEPEDEKIRKHLITLFTEDYGKNSSARFAGIKVKDILAWLEKIGKNTTNKVESNLLTHERAMEISPFMRSGFENQSTTWSEEDDIRLNATVSFLERYKGIDYENTGVCISWLKSFKERYTWKPSEEQITWLYRAADDASKDSRMKQVLNNLL